MITSLRRFIDNLLEEPPIPEWVEEEFLKELDEEQNKNPEDSQ